MENEIRKSIPIKRHIFPGNNTPVGFFSYYKYILGQKEANRIMCVKGGPGVGKSTFMRRIGEEFFSLGESVDFMHCSSDDNSIDGILLVDRKIALIDATSPHIVDPVTPGAVDEIINLGEFWNEDGIGAYKAELLTCNENTRLWYNRAYNYLGAAEKIYDNITNVYENLIENTEIYKITARIIGEELAHKEISIRPGHTKKFFAGAITPYGYVNHIDSLVQGYSKIYLISEPVGSMGMRILRILAESAVYRGYRVEEYYCPLKPDTKVEHLLIPELSTAFISVNPYHDKEPWEIAEAAQSENYPKIKHIDISDFINERELNNNIYFIEESNRIMKLLMDRSIECLRTAKNLHDEAEAYYIPNMDFKKIDALRDETVAKIKRMGL